MCESKEKIKLSAFEKKIYNQWLITTRVNQGKPFKIRENFDNIKPETAIALMRIAKRFSYKSKKYINLKVYFEAPYHFNKDKDYFPLEFFCNFNCIAYYRKYYDKFLLEDPENEKSLEFLKESISFIHNFCKSKKIKISEYIQYSFGAIPAWLHHLHDRKISIYILFAFKDFQGSFNKQYTFRKEMLSSNYDLDRTRTRYLSSLKTKKNVTLFKKYVEEKGN